MAKATKGILGRLATNEITDPVAAREAFQIGHYQPWSLVGPVADNGAIPLNDALITFAAAPVSAGAAGEDVGTSGLEDDDLGGKLEPFGLPCITDEKLLRLMALDSVGGAGFDRGFTHDSPIDDEPIVPITVGGTVTGVIDFAGDTDDITVTLVAGQRYLISLRGSTSLPDTYLNIYDPSMALVNHDDDGGVGTNSLLTITAAASGTYTIRASAYPGDPSTGQYTVDVRQMGADSVGSTAATSVLINQGTTFGFRETAVGSAVSITAQDSDTYKVHLEAGKLYSFSVAGGYDAENQATGIPGVGEIDTQIRLIGTNGTTVLVTNDDINFPSDASSALSYLAPATGDYYLSVRGYGEGNGGSGIPLLVGRNTGGYVIDFHEIDLSTLNPLDSIDWRSAGNMPTVNVGGVPTAYVYFAVAGENFGENARAGDPTQPAGGGNGTLVSYGWTQYEKDQFLAAMQEYTKILGITYVETSDASLAAASGLRVITNSSLAYGAYAYPQDPAFGTQKGIAVFNVDNRGWNLDDPNPAITTDGLGRGGYAWSTILHEMGHAHGLAHPHDNGGGSDVMAGVTASQGSLGVFNLNQQVYTQMSYNGGWWTHPDGSVTGTDPTGFRSDAGWEATLGAFDIAELQLRYGVHPDYATGDTVYTLKDVNAEGTYFECIYDTGGNDTIAYSGIRNAQIDLNTATLDYTVTGGGIMSFVHNVAGETAAQAIKGGFTIANGVVIENASGGTGDDVLIGNSVGNTLTGNNGNDSLLGRGGDDNLVGGAGTDTAFYDGVRADYTITANFVAGALTGFTITDNNTSGPTSIVIANEGTDTLTGMEAAHFSDVTFSLAGSVVLFDGSNNLVGVFTTIQAAVDAASDGYTIQAGSGTYNENVTVDVDVTILGANAGTAGTDTRVAETVINGAVYMHAAGSTLDGVEIHGGSTIAGVPCGIYVDVDDVTLTNLFLDGVGTGSLPAVTTPYNGNVSGLELSDSLVTGWDWGTYFNPTTQFEASGNTFDGNGNGILGDDWAAGTSIHDNVFSNSVGSHIGYGVFASVTDMTDFVGTNNFDADSNAVSMFAYGDGTPGGQTITGTDGANGFFASEFVAGSGTDSTFNGGAGNDYFYGGSSNDNLNGGADVDTAAYDGPSTDYTIVYEFDGGGNVIGFLEVTDNNAGNGNEGHDFLNSVEALHFSNVDIDVTDPVKVYNVSNDLVGTFDNIQDAVNFSADGYTITVASGTYVEQVVVNNIDNLTIKAETGASVTIEAPADVVQTGTKASSQGVEALMTVIGSANFTLSGIDMDGNGAGNTVTAGNDFVGLFLRNSSGTVLDADITGIRDPYVGGTTAGGDPLVSGVQRGAGVVVNNDSDQSFIMVGGSITDFQKGGMSILHGDVIISGVTIAGGGAQTTIAQNGIVLVTSTGSIDGNTITGIGYAGAGSTYSGGVLAFGSANLFVTDNIITGSNDQSTDAKVVGVWFFDAGGATGDANSGGAVVGNTISYVDTGVEVDGDVTPSGISIGGNTITNVDLTDPFADGVFHAPTPSYDVAFEVEGSNFQDYLGGAASNDVLTGLGGNDEFQGYAGDDVLHGDGGTDQADYAGNFADYTIVYELDGGGNIIGFLEVTDNVPAGGDEGHDTLSSIEVLKFADITLNLTDPVRLFDGSNTLVGTFTSIQDAIDAASNGYRITADAGTYSENLTVDKDVTIQGANVGLAGTDGGRAAETVIDGQVTVTVAGVTIDGVKIVGDAPGSLGTTGVEVTANNFSLVNSVLDGSGFTGIITGTVTGLNIGRNLIEGYSVGIYVSGNTTAGSIHDNRIQGDGPGSGSGVQEGLFLETSHVTVQSNTFDGIDGGSIFANPHGPDPVDLNTILLLNTITNSGADRPVQVLASDSTTHMVGTDFAEAFYDPNYGTGSQIAASLGFDGRGGNDHIFGNFFGDTFSGGAGSDEIYGDAGDDVMSGDADNDLLDGGSGIDTASFSTASVTYVDTLIGWVTTSADGTDVLENVEIAQTGSVRNLLVGSTGFATIQDASNAALANNIIRVATGTWGGTVTYDDQNLTVIAQPNAVLNTTFSTATAFGITVFGGVGADNITGSANKDYIDGGAGVDTLNGGGGNDFLVVNVGDQVIEGVGGGTDNVISSTSYTLNAGAAVEFLSTTDHGGTANIDLTGNEFGQVVIGNAGSNVLRGGGGIDVLQGLGGNDYLYVDSDDFVLEAVGGGTDNVLSSTSYTLNSGAAVEFLSTDNHAGTGAINLTGNEFGQVVIGNAGSNILAGGGGLDVLQGLGGNDFLLVDGDDVVLEAVGGGYDNVCASASFTLNAGQEIEVLSTNNHPGTAAINLKGNEFGQVVIGNAGNNTIDGGLGQDNLQGLGGNDVFAFTTTLGGTNVDNILDFSAGDKIGLGAGVFTAAGPLGALNANAFFAGTAAHDADDRIIYDSATGNVYYDADGNGAGAQILFANVIGHPVLAASDFSVI